MIDEDLTIDDALNTLMARPLKSETAGALKPLARKPAFGIDTCRTWFSFRL